MFYLVPREERGRWGGKKRKYHFRSLTFDTFKYHAPHLHKLRNLSMNFGTLWNESSIIAESREIRFNCKVLSKAISFGRVHTCIYEILCIIT